MISKLRGKVDYVGDKYIILDVAGVGYKINLTSTDLQKLTSHSVEKKEASFWTYLSVREDAMELYGFLDKDELSFFELLIGISGIGPKRALAILSVAPVETIKKALRARDTSYLTQVSGIGRKNAEKIILELRDKFEALEEGDSNMSLREESDVLEAVKSLGYSLAESREALKNIPPEISGLDEKIKYALRHLGK